MRSILRTATAARAAIGLPIVIRIVMAYILDSEPIARAASDPKGGREFDLKT